MSGDSARDSIEERWPSASALEFGCGCVEGCVACSAGVYTRSIVGVVDACSRTLGAFLAEDFELR